MKIAIWGMFLIICAFQAVDVWQTHMILVLGGYEMNPLADFFIQRYGTIQGLLIYKVPGMALLAIGLVLLQRRTP